MGPLGVVPLGAIERAVGLHGEVRLRLFNPESRTLTAGSAVELRRGGQRVRAAVVESVRYPPEAAVVRLEGIVDRDAAEALRGCEICVPREALPPLEPGEHYHVDLVGLEVRAPGGERLGEVAEVIAYPSVDALVVRSGDDEREVPIVEGVVLELDPGRGFVIVDGLADFPERPRRRAR